MSLATLATYDDVLEFLQDHVLRDPSFDQDYLLAILTMADGLIAQEYAWSFLLTEDTSKTRAANDTYATAYALPTNYLYTDVINVGEAENEYEGVPFKEKIKNYTIANKFWVDHKNSNFYLSGTEQSSKTIHHFYIQPPTTAALSAVPSWPAQFRHISAYAAADILSGTDTDVDGIMVAKANVFSKQTMKILDAMKMLDAKRSRTSTAGNYMSRKRVGIIGNTFGQSSATRSDVIY